SAQAIASSTALDLIEPELVVAMRPLDLDAGALAQFGCGGGMIEMTVRQPNARERQPEVGERTHQPVDVAAGIDERRVLRRRVTYQRTILLQRRHPHEADLQFGL